VPDVPRLYEFSHADLQGLGDNDGMEGVFLSKQRWLPESVSASRLQLSNFVRDLIAGITVGLVAPAPAMAFLDRSRAVRRKAGCISFCAIGHGFLIFLPGRLEDPRSAGRRAPSSW